MNLTEQIIKAGPGQTVEFIEAPDVLDAVAKHVVAFLNSGGGYVILGVNKAGQVLGVPNAEAVVADLQARLIENISPKAYLDLGVDPIEGREVVVVVVPAGKDAPFVTDGRVFLRRGSATVAATGGELQSILQKRVAELERWERRIAPTLTEDDFDLEEVRASIRSIQELKKAVLPKSAEEPLALLMTLGMVLRGQFTNAADICFGHNPAIRHAQVRVRCFVFQTDKGGDFIDQRTLSGPVAKVFEQAVAFIQERAPVAAQFTEEQLYRTESTAYPLQVLREGLVNALAHRDYASFSGGVTIEVFPTRVEIWNSGSLPAGWDARKLRTSHPSLPANPDIAHYLYSRGYMERIGRGTLKMIQACQEENIQTPSWEVDSDGVKLTLHSRVSRATSTAQLNQRQQALLDSLGNGVAVNLTDYQKDFAPDVSERQARRDLSKLVDADFLRQEGKGPATQYIRTKRKPAKP